MSENYCKSEGLIDKGGEEPIHHSEGRKLSIRKVMIVVYYSSFDPDVNHSSWFLAPPMDQELPLLCRPVFGFIMALRKRF